MKKKYFYCMMMCLAGLLVGCSDDEVNVPDNVIPVLKGSTGAELTITRLGFGCDITQEIGNSREHILNLNALKEDGAIVLDENVEYLYVETTGKDYASMTDSINKYLVGNVPSVPQMAFSWNLDAISDKKANQLDIYEYGVAMTIKKLYEVDVKQDFVSKLKDYVRESVWAEINATDKSNRTDKAAIKQLYKTYGTHVATRISVGGMHRGVLFREQNEWESKMGAQLALFVDGIAPLHNGFTEAGIYDGSIGETDWECYKHAPREECEQRKGGNLTMSDVDEWFGSITSENYDFLGYGLGVNPSGQDSGLIPLYELLDEGDERRTAMKEALDEYVEENRIPLEKRRVVILDAFGKHFSTGKNAPEYMYEEKDGKILKYFRLDEEMLQHVYGVRKGCFYFYYALGHLLDEAVYDMKFANSSDIDGDWHTRGDHANEGVSGDVKNRYLCVKYASLNDEVSEKDFVTGFGVKVDGKVKSISKYTETAFKWEQNENCENWYKGLVHDDVYCIYAKDTLKDFN